MPFRSKAQQRWMFAAEGRGELPEGTARRWAHHTKKIKALPEHVSDKPKEKSAATTDFQAIISAIVKQAVAAAVPNLTPMPGPKAATPPPAQPLVPPANNQPAQQSAQPPTQQPSVALQFADTPSPAATQVADVEKALHGPKAASTVTTLAPDTAILVKLAYGALRARNAPVRATPITPQRATARAPAIAPTRPNAGIYGRTVTAPTMRMPQGRGFTPPAFVPQVAQPAGQPVSPLTSDGMRPTTAPLQSTTPAPGGPPPTREQYNQLPERMNLQQWRQMNPSGRPGGTQYPMGPPPFETRQPSTEQSIGEPAYGEEPAPPMPPAPPEQQAPPPPMPPAPPEQQAPPPMPPAPPEQQAPQPRLDFLPGAPPIPGRGQQAPPAPQQQANDWGGGGGGGDWEPPRLDNEFRSPLGPVAPIHRTFVGPGGQPMDSRDPRITDEYRPTDMGNHEETMRRMQDERDHRNMYTNLPSWGERNRQRMWNFAAPLRNRLADVGNAYGEVGSAIGGLWNRLTGKQGSTMTPMQLTNALLHDALVKSAQMTIYSPRPAAPPRNQPRAPTPISLPRNQQRPAPAPPVMPPAPADGPAPAPAPAPPAPAPAPPAPAPSAPPAPAPADGPLTGSAAVHNNIRNIQRMQQEYGAAMPQLHGEINNQLYRLSKPASHSPLLPAYTPFFYKLAASNDQPQPYRYITGDPAQMRSAMGQTFSDIGSIGSGIGSAFAGYGRGARDYTRMGEGISNDTDRQWDNMPLSYRLGATTMRAGREVGNFLNDHVLGFGRNFLNRLWSPPMAARRRARQTAAPAAAPAAAPGDAHANWLRGAS